MDIGCNFELKKGLGKYAPAIPKNPLRILLGHPVYLYIFQIRLFQIRISREKLCQKSMRKKIKEGKNEKKRIDKSNSNKRNAHTNKVVDKTFLG